jgi:hypothetical protein
MEFEDIIFSAIKHQIFSIKLPEAVERNKPWYP